MSQRRTTGPPTRIRHESSASGRSELTARGKTKKQSAKERTALDSRFHRTYTLAKLPANRLHAVRASSPAQRSLSQIAPVVALPQLSHRENAGRDQLTAPATRADAQ